MGTDTPRAESFRRGNPLTIDNLTPLIKSLPRREFPDSTAGNALEAMVKTIEEFVSMRSII